MKPGELPIAHRVVLDRIVQGRVDLEHGRAERDYHIREAVRLGITTRTIAEYAGLSFAQVARIAKAAR